MARVDVRPLISNKTVALPLTCGARIVNAKRRGTRAPRAAPPYRRDDRRFSGSVLFGRDGEAEQ
ncbi:MAG: hypothetical protein RIF44_10015, partial [Nitratireductor sp.]